MANRTGTYIAFDGLGQTDPTKSDFKYYATIQSWNSSKHIDFKLVDSHDKTYAVKDSSLLQTLKSRINERLAASKNFVCILSDDTRKSGSLLSYEIERAVDYYKLPLILMYVGYETVFEPALLHSRWPNSLTTRINDQSAKAIHIPFKKNALLDAISQFSTNKPHKLTSLNHYTKEAQISFGCQF